MTGRIVVTFDEFLVSPNSPDFNPITNTLANGQMLSAAASVTVTGGPTTPTPEPSSALLMLAGLATGWAVVRRRVPLQSLLGTTQILRGRHSQRLG